MKELILKKLFFEKFDNKRIFIINLLLVLLAFCFAFSETKAKGIVIIAFLFWLSIVRLNDIIIVLKKPVVYFLFLFITLLGAFVLYTDGGSTITLKYIERYLIYLIIPMFMFATVLHKKYVPIVIFAFIFGMILNEIISYGILFGFWLHLKEGYPVYFMHHVFYSVLLSFTVMALIYRFMIEKNLFLKVVEVIFILTMFGNLVISGGRTGQFTLIGTFILTFLFFTKISIRRLSLILLIPIVVFSLSYFTYSKFQERIDMFVDDTKVSLVSHEYTSSFGNRLLGYVLTANMLEVQEIQNILFGFGIDNVQNEKKVLLTKCFSSTPNIQGGNIQFHSSYMDITWWSGLIGLYLILSFLIAIIRVKIQDPNVNFLKISLFFTILFSSFADSIMDNQYTLLLMAMFVGVILTQNRYEMGEVVSEKQKNNDAIVENRTNKYE